MLVNGKTASAAEIVAGALAFNHRAVLVGTRTRGKGAIQGMFRLPDGMGEMNLTTAEFLLGDGQSISRRAGSDRLGRRPARGGERSPRWTARKLSQLRSRAGGGPAACPGTDHPPAQGEPPRRDAAARRPSTSPTAIAATRALLALDSQLRKAVELLADPETFDAILHPAAAPAPNPSAAP